ncbi:DUF1996 domain-containing protein [Streptomyces sp. NBC_00829]|uniref:DUF1996 domain-containing protein n=1 Tax=Streptomyces sp. NBC_00829 TaxID=2903679 RepID=UPI0038707FFE|nr:DUF1996 domain-containing protein [Streptomyces sp. NBC_00829]
MDQRHKVKRSRRNALLAVAGLLLGGGGLVGVNAIANAGSATGQSENVACPAVAERLPRIPGQARGEVDRELALMKQQTERANARMSRTKGGEEEVVRIVLHPLGTERAAALERIEVAIERAGADRPEGLQSLAVCTTGGHGSSSVKAGGNADGDDQGGDDGPSAEDFVDITSVAPNVQRVGKGRKASTGSFVSRCGVNRKGLFNSDNVIVAPGVDNGAHHTHDYVGALGVNAFTTNESLAASRTTCTNGDRSTYYWPVLRDLDGVQQSDADQPGGGAEGNVGKILTPASVSLQFVGSPRTKVTAMPRFLRIITGDAKANANGGANANARWTCTGFESRVELKDKYPICPQGSKVVRVSKFQSCWDGANTDSANHRSHVAFADARGNCPKGFRAIPQLVQRITYNGLAGSTRFAVDSFPESFHKPITDHGDFINAMPLPLMRKAVACINTGRRCR